jgi:2-polyprenyl-3-methyl-5-hydroxy-6-metoxy-1,4-benzoquinol methylase
MCAERLHFLPGQMDYHAKLAAEHVSRYRFAASVCTGRRVLDAACGEGYGSHMLAELGAASVVGVDIAEEAIAVARTRFARDGVSYIVGDVLKLPSLLKGHKPFDVIVGFETIEHLSDPRRYLEGLQRVLAPDGIIILSCPNDELEAKRGITNPYHARIYRLPEFQALTTAVLGAATDWYLGTPVQGMVVAPANLAALRNDNRDLGLLSNGLVTPSTLLPAQADVRVQPETCSFFVGVWGAAPDATQVATPMSQSSFLEPWLAIDWLKGREKELEAANTGRAVQVGMLEERIAQQQQAALAERDGQDKTIDWLKGREKELEAANADRSAQVGMLEEQIAQLRQAALVQRDRQDEALEWLKRREQELEAANADRSAQVGMLEEQIAQLRQAALVQRDRQDAMSRSIVFLQEIERSRGYRLLKWYYSLVDSRWLGVPLRAMRRFVGCVLRAVR